MKILFLSHTYWGSVFRVGSHHLSEKMAAMGHKVLYVPVPVTPLHFLKKNRDLYRLQLAGKMHEVSPNLFQYIPKTLVPPGRFCILGKDLAFFLRRNGVEKVLRGLHFDEFDLVFIDHPKLYGVLQFIKYKKLVYRPTDMMAGIGMSGYYMAEKTVIDVADALVVTSKPVGDKIHEIFGYSGPYLIQENGVDLAHFSSWEGAPPVEYLNSSYKTKAVYVGAIDERFSFLDIQRLSKFWPGVGFYIIGPTDGVNKKEFKKNVFFIGKKDFSSIPAYLKNADLALLPLSDHPANAGRSPMKIYEYLSCGLPVLSKLTLELERRKLPGVLMYSDISEVENSLDDILSMKSSAAVPDELDWKSIATKIISFSMAQHTSFDGLEKLE